MIIEILVAVAVVLGVIGVLDYLLSTDYPDDNPNSFVEETP